MTETPKPPFIPPEVLRAKDLADALEKEGRSPFIAPNVKVALAREQTELIKELTQIAKRSEERSTEARIISIAGLLIAAIALAMQYLKG